MTHIALVRALSLALTVVTGFTALVYEVTWHYYLANLLGSQARSAALIVSTFLGGLAVGYAMFGRYSTHKSPRALVRGCGVLEFLIGVWALLFPLLERGVWWIQFESHLFSGSIMTDAFLVALLVGAPTMMMGASLPLLTQGLSLSVEDAAPFHAKIYVANTFGAFLGALCAGFLLIPAFGLDVTMMIMGGANVSAGLVFAAISFWVRNDSVPNDDAADVAREVHSGSPLRHMTLFIIACAGGFVSITLQTVLMRVVSLTIGASVYTFGMVLSAFIFVLALGAWALSERRILRVSLAANQVVIIAGLVSLYFLIPYLPYASHVLRTLLTTESPSFWVYHGALFFFLCLLILVPVGGVGAMLPLLFKESRDRAELLGNRVGLVYGANTIGCVVGAILGGYLALYLFNLDRVLSTCIVGAGLILLLLARTVEGRRGSLCRALAFAVLLFPLVSEPWPKYAFARGTFRITKASEASYRGFEAFYDFMMGRQEILAYKDDPNTTVAVLDSGSAGKSILINGKSDGSTRSGDRETTKLMAHLPGLLQTSTSERAAVVGFGTGITVGSLAKYSDIKHIDILEIAPAVKKFAPLFDDENGDATESDKVVWNIGDAYRFLLETPHRYAIIASEPSNPWVGGVERLYSKDFYDVARNKLSPGGIYAQWFHTYSISNETMALVLNTFHKSFPFVHLFERDSDVILIGSNEDLEAKSLVSMRDRFARPEIAADLKDIDMQHPNQLLGREVPMPWDGLFDAPVQTLNRPTLSYRAAKDFFGEAYVYATTFASLPEYRGYSRSFFPKTLMARLYGDQPEQEKLQSFALLNCSAKAQAGNSWDQQSQLCRQVLVAMVVGGHIPVNETVPESVKDLFLNLAPGVHAPVLVAPSAEAAGIGLDWMTEYGAPFLKLDPERMREYVQSCFAGSGDDEAACRGRLVLALAANGFQAEARREFSSLLDDRLALRDLGYAQTLARVVQVPLSAKQEANLPLID